MTKLVALNEKAKKKINVLEVKKAIYYAKKYHGAQKRETGEPYYSHPLEVASMVSDYLFRTDILVTSILHDTIEDTPATLEEIRDLFGDEIAFLVDGVTKLSKIELQSDKSQQAENFRKLVLAMSKDLRVLLVKLADRIHNMRTLQYKNSKEKRRRISKETMEIYAPLAERIGMHEMRNELEDLSFSYLDPESHGLIVSRLEVMRKKGEDVVGRVMEQLKEVLVREGVYAMISGREKTPHSIWKKLQKKDVEFEQLSDVMAFRIVVSSLTDCYQALGIIHSTYSMIPGRFKDYISTPKQNGYQSLHTTVIGPESQRIEIQIRTKDMHDVAEMGVAAHWRYKEGDSGQDKKGTLKADGVQYQWVREILDIL
ncbi:MAG: bifunctional (p)ppGpp synthetase/guanosine-3',5'-bis(diphosphate) 3'-pyrophosphohydrolase, partial [Alphaproteobacteria bacterium]|nr:bifunctional (p)ppGpp synthetase/guanosine-3',5'-bis(diphosphate) 3'-pyrophosphohydrolase [Alphaproteobacteria bacterium]